jgi:hypothetical protein
LLFRISDRVIPPFLTIFKSRDQATMASFWIGVIPIAVFSSSPAPSKGRSANHLWWVLRLSIRRKNIRRHVGFPVKWTVLNQSFPALNARQSGVIVEEHRKIIGM